MKRRSRKRHSSRRRRAHSNPSTKTWLVVGGLGVAGAVALFFIFRAKNAAASTTPQLPSGGTTPAMPAYTPQAYSFSSNNSGGSVTLRPGDTVSFALPNDPAAASTANKDWFWTTAPALGYQGRTTQVVGNQLVETDTFVWGGGAPSTQAVVAQLLTANGPATPTAGPTPPVATFQNGASTFQFTINTLSS
jgi:hypothetical protein